MESPWYKLNDDDVLMHYVSPVDPNDEAWVPPSFHEENGTPVDTEGNDMEFEGTYIKDL